MSMLPTAVTRDVSAREGYDIWAEIYDNDTSPVIAMDRRHTMRVLACKPEQRVLDAGCGTGRNLGAMIAAGAMPVGLDFSPGMLAVARKRFRAVPLYEVDLQARYPLGDGGFDAVLCSLVADQLSDPSAALREMARVTRPRGRLVWSVPHPRLAAAGMRTQFLKDGVQYRLGAHPYTAEQYEAWMQQAGFALTSQHEYIGGGERAFAGFPVLLVMEAIKRI
jgi:ubiquinone/menaquinone biosynthesis C-methylase UbiE